ncbi:MAG: response regulator [Dysgonamonadaceae bacterium]|nr:response regulator [Dysgonamonadaceae bacterium]
MKPYFLSTLIIISFFTMLHAQEENTSCYKFNHINTWNGLPSNDVQKVYQDRDGYIWIATRNGLSQYNGYSIKTYKSNLYHPALLSSNNIFCLVEDFKHRLWIGTDNGLNMLDKTTGLIRTIDRKEFNDNAVSSAIVTKQGKLLLGTDKGLYEYRYETDTCIPYDKSNTNGVFQQTSVKSLLEDSRGDLWIGTWNEGLYRYEAETGKYYAYPRMNPQKSAHVIFEDSQKRIWVGTWGYGLFLLENVYNPAYTSWKIFSHTKNDSQSISDNIIYDIAEDVNNGALWVGTRSGLSILPMNASSSFTNYYPNNSNCSIAGNEVNSLLRDTQGLMWLGMIGSGVNNMNTRKPLFDADRLEEAKNMYAGNSVKSMFVESDELVWLGIGQFGLFIENRKTGQLTHSSQLRDFQSFTHVQTVMAITKSSRTGKIWIGTYGDGIFIYDKSAPEGSRLQNLTPKNTNWLPSGVICAIKEDSKGNIWIGTRQGLCMLTPDGIEVQFNSLIVSDKLLGSISIMAIEEGKEDEMWIGSNNDGVIHISGDGTDASRYTVEHFSTGNAKLNSINCLCLHKDRQNNIWAGMEGGGLNHFDAQKKTFIPVHKEWNLPGDIIFSILGDKQGNLWCGTNVGLIKIDVTRKNYHLYTISDGLQDNIYNRNAAFAAKDGELFFGGHLGYNYFYPENLTENNSASPVVITDIKIFNQSWEQLDDKLKNKISKQSPEFTTKVTLDYKHNNFNIEFSSLCYINPSQNKYTYMLEDFDKEWIYTDASHRFAYYNNLSAGKYRFRLKAANSFGVWSELPQTLEITVLPPPWKTWWAYIIYMILLGIAAYYIFKMTRNRLNLRNSLHIKELEKTKLEELNHAKLQFFTNITHELLTPLTIISATVDELKITAPQNSEFYRIMTSNINRLIRLLQQILEFRKAETGNLKLKVSKGDLATFAHNEMESFRPLMKKKMLHFSIICNPEPFPAYFDPDKMDKILYNLLSNAAKYNSIDGTVWIDLRIDETGYYAVIKVRDNGKGMSKEAQNNLFKRFYEGDYRKYNTIGTGIGLSLVKDLVKLHNGDITVESELNQGTEFTVKIPIRRESYKEEEIDDTVVLPSAPCIISNEDKPGKADVNNNSLKNSLLLLEDNGELLNLMVKLLGAEYRLFTGNNGKEGVEIVENEEIDLIVSDIMMPEMDGIEFCKYVKGNLDICHIPLILLTAKNSEEDRVEAYDSGADAFINKPFNLSVLHSRIGNLLKAKARVSHDFKKQLVIDMQNLDYTSMDEDFLKKAINFVQAHLTDIDFGSEQLQQELAISKATLYRKLKSLTGLNATAFIRNIRLKAACRIMEEKKNIRVSELAYAVGFNDPKYFSACFKKEFGIQPSEYISRFTTKPELLEE